MKTMLSLFALMAISGCTLRPQPLPGDVAFPEMTPLQPPRVDNAPQPYDYTFTTPMTMGSGGVIAGSPHTVTVCCQ